MQRPPHCPICRPTNRTDKSAPQKDLWMKTIENGLDSHKLTWTESSQPESEPSTLEVVGTCRTVAMHAEDDEVDCQRT